MIGKSAGFGIDAAMPVETGQIHSLSDWEFNIFNFRNPCTDPVDIANV